MAGSTNSCVRAPTPSRPGAPKCCATSSRNGCWACLDLGKLAAVTAVASKAASPSAKPGVDRGVMAVFAGLMLGSLVASLNMTLVAPALPTVVSGVGGLADYSWVPLSAMLASTIVVPIAGKLSDIYGRKPLYMSGIVVFAVGSALSGVAPNFWFLIFARFIQGAGMGFIMPLSQAIIGDIISPRERGKYQGMLGAFVWVERHAPEPVLPLHLFRSGIFTLSNIAIVGVAMSMFGAIFFLPVFVQGVIGNSVTNSGAILVPMLVSMIVTSVAGGWFISHTGRYKMPLLAGLVSMGAGYYMLATFSVETTNQSVIEAMILIGLGLGITMQTFTLVVQNSVSREDMAVATSATQLSRSVGAAIGLAILGTILTQGMQSAMAKYLPASVLHQLQSSDRGATATAVFDPSQLAHLPPAVASAIRHGLADALHPVFLAGLPIIAVSFIATLFIQDVALRQTAHVTAGRRNAHALPEPEKSPLI